MFHETFNSDKIIKELRLNSVFKAVLYQRVEKFVFCETKISSLNTSFLNESSIAALVSWALVPSVLMNVDYKSGVKLKL